MNTNMEHSDRIKAVGRPIGSILRLVATMIWGTTAMIGLAQQTSPARDLVNPFIGTGGHGHTFPGACVPNGMVQLSPDTRPDGYNDWDGCGGYHYSDSVIYGFSHTHLSGTGVADLCDVLLSPIAGTGGMAFDRRSTASRFDHASEQANAGYYKVDLLGAVPSSADGSSVNAARPTRIEGSRIIAELTASARVGVHRYTFPKGQAARIALDLRHRDQLTGVQLQRVGDSEVVGERSSSSWARSQRLFFCIRFSKPIKDEDVMPSDLYGKVAGYGFGALQEPLVVKVGISAVSIDGARANLDAEVPHWDFDRVRNEAEAAWNAKLNKVQIKGGTLEQQRVFHTALYHSYVAPYIFNDVDGQYRGMDGQVHKAEHNVYTVFSLWDTFRALHPLMIVLEPDMTRDWIKTFLLHYQQGGRLPVWELWGNETDCMIGYHSVSVIADAYAKGIRDFDTDLALEAMVSGAEADHFGLQAYRERGYISSEDEPESVSRTLEYAYDDACIAWFNEALGEKDRARHYRNRSRSWINLFDPSTKFFRARRNGGFIEPFDPYEVNFNFTEANAWQYGFFVPHDMEYYLPLINGPSGLGKRLEALFNAGERTTGRDQSDITGLIGQYAHGNEPSHHFAYLSNLSDIPMATDGRVQRIMKEFYRDAPDGLIGNEDCGQMSAWFVWSAMGLYPLCPGRPEYTTGVPLFDEVLLHLPNGKTTTITSTATANDRTYVEHIAWNDRDLPRFRMLDHSALVGGGHLHFDLGPRPGSGPSFIDEDRIESTEAPTRVAMVPPAPILLAPPSFTDSCTVHVRVVEGPWELRGTYQLDGDPEPHEMPRSGKLVLHTSATVTVHAEGARGKGPSVSGRYLKLDHGRTLKLESAYANQYAASGDRALIDGLRGGKDFRSGEWQGYQGQDVNFTIDLGSVKKLERVGIGALQDQRSWIWLPQEVVVATSINGRQWSTTSITNEVDRRAEGSFTRDFWTGVLDRKARYISMKVKNAGPCPDWHPSKGGASWIFLDEVLIEVK